MMKAIIVDDEEKGRRILVSMLEKYCPLVSVVASAADVAEAYDAVLQHKPDLVFLDIEMPNGNGFTLLERFATVPFGVIFTTAYDNYAIRAIKSHALDYLLKPIDVDELKLAVQRAAEAQNTETRSSRYAEFLADRRFSYTGRIALPVKEGVIYLPVADIVRVESDGCYSSFYTIDNRKYVVARNIGEYEELLPEAAFYRVHKSHLVNIKRVKKFLRNDGYYLEMEDGSTVEMARRKRDEFLQLMERVV